MTTYLTACLYAPIGAMGGQVAGSTRLGWDRPGRSAIMGLVAAALGIDRDRDAEHLNLDQSLGLGMLIERSGDVFVDFHTTRVASGQPTWSTRRQEVAAVRINDYPVVSMREYRSNIVVLLALWLRGPSAYSLEEIAAALARPTYMLYMGRRCCPFGLPLAPAIEEATDVQAALLARRDAGPERAYLRSITGYPTTPPRSSRNNPRLSWHADLEAIPTAAYETEHRPTLTALTRFAPPPFFALDEDDAPDGVGIRDVRADRLASRTRWQYLPRTERLLPVPTAAS